MEAGWVPKKLGINFSLAFLIFYDVIFSSSCYLYLKEDA